VGIGDNDGKRRSSLAAGGALILLCSLVGILWFAVRARRELHTNVDGVTFGTGIALIGLGMLALVWFLFFFFWARGAIRVAAVSRMLPDAVLLDGLMNYGLESDLDQMNAILGVPGKAMWSNGYITVAATTDSLAFYSRAFRPRLLCSVPAELVATIGIETLDFPTRTVTRHFPALVITPRGKAEGFTIGMLPMRTTLMVPRKLNDAQLRSAVDDLASRLGASVAVS
jgi:hypothetical protein